MCILNYIYIMCNSNGIKYVTLTQIKCVNTTRAAEPTVCRRVCTACSKFPPHAARLLSECLLFRKDFISNWEWQSQVKAFGLDYFGVFWMNLFGVFDWIFESQWNFLVGFLDWTFFAVLNWIFGNHRKFFFRNGYFVTRCTSISSSS